MNYMIKSINYLSILNFLLIDRDFVGQWLKHAHEEQIRRLESHKVGMPLRVAPNK